jgi:hypothetical protein
MKKLRVFLLLDFCAYSFSSAQTVSQDIKYKNDMLFFEPAQ